MKKYPSSHFSDTYTAEFDDPADSVTLVSPGTGKYLVVTDVYCMSEATSGTITFKFETSNNTVAKFYMASGKSHYKVGSVKIVGNSAEPIKVTSTTSADDNYLILVNYRVENRPS